MSWQMTIPAVPPPPRMWNRSTNNTAVKFWYGSKLNWPGNFSRKKTSMPNLIEILQFISEVAHTVGFNVFPVFFLNFFKELTTNEEECGCLQRDSNPQLQGGSQPKEMLVPFPLSHRHPLLILSGSVSCVSMVTSSTSSLRFDCSGPRALSVRQEKPYSVKPRYFV